MSIKIKPLNHEEDQSLNNKHLSGNPKIHPKPTLPSQNTQANSDTVTVFPQPGVAMATKETNQKNSSKSSNRNSKISEKYNSSVLRSLKQNLKTSDTICTAFSCLAIFIAWIENDIFFNNGNVSNSGCHVLRGMVTSLCVVVHFYIYKHYKLKLEILKSQRIIYQKTQLRQSNQLKFYLIEILFNYIHCPPFFDFVLPNEQLGIHFEISFDAYASVIMLGRLYVFFRLFDHYTFWTGERASRVCKINGFAPNSKFAIKAYLQYKPYLVLIICFFFSILLFGFALRTFERPYNSPSRRFNFNYMWNSFWCVVVTMTTIGYGDIYPQTHLGRFVIIVACIWGVFILSLFVVALNNTIQLSKEENNAFEQISHQDKIQKDLKQAAGHMIAKFMWLLHAKKKKMAAGRRILLRMDLIGLASRFKIKRKNARKVAKKIVDIIKEMDQEVDREVSGVIESIQPLKKTLPNIVEAEETQSLINEQMMQVFENSKKLMTLLVQINKEQKSEYKGLEEVVPRFDAYGNEVETQISP